ncbi:MAG: hypothetical protein IKY43_03605 [Bacteroidales bacterium]|nr:hypothetical protein [Bacteroidales bacterium]
MMGQKKVEIFSKKFRKSLAKQFLEVAYNSIDFISLTGFLRVRDFFCSKPRSECRVVIGLLIAVSFCGCNVFFVGKNF